MNKLEPRQILILILILILLLKFLDMKCISDKNLCNNRKNDLMSTCRCEKRIENWKYKKKVIKKENNKFLIKCNSKID